MSNSVRGMLAGLIATLVLSALMLVKRSMGLWPELSLIQLLINLGSITPVQAWMDHFIIGVIVWGLIYGALDAMMPDAAHWLKGLILAVGAWLFMMVAFMPLAKAGFFGLAIGPIAAAVALGYHVVYGLVLGISYGILTAWLPAKTESQA